MWLFKFQILLKIFECMDIWRGWITNYVMILKDQMLERLQVIFELKGVWSKEKKGFGDLQKERGKKCFMEIKDKLGLVIVIWCIEMASFRFWSLMSMDAYMGWVIRDTDKVGKGNKTPFPWKRNAHT